MGFFEFIRNNFFHVLPIIAAGGIAIAIILERSHAFFQVYPMSKSRSFLDKISELVIMGRTGEAVSLCDKTPEKPLALVTKSAILRAHLPDHMVENAVEVSLGDATQAIRKRTSYLSTIANVATLLGLFGTILGLIHSFEAVGQADAQQKSALLAAGISTAMNATMMGLGVAIPCIVAFSFLINKSNRLIAELDNDSVRILDIIKQRYYTDEFESNEITNLNPGSTKAVQISRKRA